MDVAVLAGEEPRRALFVGAQISDDGLNGGVPGFRRDDGGVEGASEVDLIGRDPLDQRGPTSGRPDVLEGDSVEIAQGVGEFGVVDCATTSASEVERSVVASCPGAEASAEHPVVEAISAAALSATRTFPSVLNFMAVLR